MTIGPDDTVDLDGGESLPPNPDVELDLGVVLAPEQVEEIAQLARRGGRTMSDSTWRATLRPPG
jgi:hypothetical protein